MMDAFDTYEHAGLTVELHYDDSGVNPRKDSDHAGVIVSFTNEYNGDERMGNPSDLTIPCPDCEEAEDSDGCKRCNGEGEVEVDISEYMEAMSIGEVVLPLRFSDYGSNGSRLYEYDADDANAVIYITDETLQKEWDGDREKAEACLRAEVAEENAWLCGEIYGYIIKGPHGEELPDKFQDSCWGFIGNDEYVRKEANSAAESVAEQLAAEESERAAMAARDIETV